MPEPFPRLSQASVSGWRVYVLSVGHSAQSQVSRSADGRDTEFRRNWYADSPCPRLGIQSLEIIHIRQFPQSLKNKELCLAKTRRSPREAVHKGRTKGSGRAEALPLLGSHCLCSIRCYGRIRRKLRLSAAMSRLEKSSVKDTRCDPPTL